MRINTNMAALNAWRSLSSSGANLQKSLEKLSSGYRINRAADDAAGLAVSEKMRAQIKGTNIAIRNAQDGISLVQTAEGALTESHAILQRIRELSLQASTGTLGTEDKLALQSEVESLAKELDRIGKSTKFNGIALLDGSISKNTIGGIGTGLNTSSGIAGISAQNVKLDAAELPTEVDPLGTGRDFSLAVTANGEKFDVTVTDTAKLTTQTLTVAKPDFGKTSGLYFNELGISVVLNDAITDISADNTFTIYGNGGITIQAGSNINDQERLNIGIGDMCSAALGVSNLNITTVAGAQAAVNATDTAINTVSTQRAELGAAQNRLEHTVASLSVSAENLTAAESRIRDVDMAQEMAEFTKYQILQQASTAMLAQANQSTQGILQLLR